MAAAIVAVGSVGSVAWAVPAGAAGHKGASFCSGSGAPTGAMPDAFGNAGELISYTARVVGHDGSFHPGPIVALNCRPSPR
jgi:hypothetical protein